MSGEAKVLNGLLQRRALEQAFAELGRLSDPAEVQRQAQTIAEYGTAALQHLLTLLDTPDPQLRGGLGQVARQLPPERVIPALRAVVRDRERGDQARLAAVTLLERFLGETVDNSMIGDLGNPDVAARQSLLELIRAMDEEPLSVIEYLEQLGQQPPDVLSMVLDAVPAVCATPEGASPHVATFLRMLAQGEDGRVARRAVDELIKLRTPASVRALISLVPNLPPTMTPAAERGLRKLKFSGIQESANHDPEREPWYAPELAWRALISPIDASGAQFLWFIGAEEDGERAVFFTVLAQDPGGVRDASGSLDAAADQVPPKRREGALHFIVGDGSAAGVTLLEAPFGLACLALREALAQNWTAGEATPLGYRLFSPLIWLAAGASGGGSNLEASDGTGEPEPDLALTEAELVAALDHPAFYGWFADIDELPARPALLASYARRLRSLSRWLAAAGEDVAARLAATLAYHFDESTPQATTILASARLASAGRRRPGSRDQH